MVRLAAVLVLGLVAVAGLVYVGWRQVERQQPPPEVYALVAAAITGVAAAAAWPRRR